MGKYMSTWWFTPVIGKTYGKASSCFVVHTSGLPVVPHKAVAEVSE